MQYKITYSQGEHYKKYSPMTVTANFQFAQKYSIKALPFTTHGCTLSILDENKEEMFKGEYSYMLCDPGFHTKMASDVAESINLLLELESKEGRMEPKELEQVMLEILNHCEFMDPRELDLHDYVAEIIFQ